MMRKEFRMTDEQLNNLLSACKSVPYIAVCGIPFSGPFEQVNYEWRKLGDELGFDHTTVEPIPGKDKHFFTAEPRISP